MNILKLFSGEQGGSEISLKTNEDVSVGNDIICDIYLATSSSNPSNFRLNLPDEEHVQFTVSGNLVMLWNNVEIDNSITYELPVFLIFDSIKIALGKPHQIIDWPVAITLEEEIVQEDLLLDATDQLELTQEINFLNKDEKLEKPIAKFKLFFTQLTQTIKQKIEPFNSYVNQKYAWVSNVIYICVGVILLLIILIIISSSVSLHQEHQIQNWLALEVELKKSFNELPSNAMSVSLSQVRDKQQFVIQGLIYSNKEKLLIQNKLAPFKSVLTYNLTLVPQAIAKIKAILTTHEMSNLNVIYQSDLQTISVTGMGNYTSNVINDAEIDITNQLANISDISFNIYETNQVKADLNHYLGNLDTLLDISTDLATGVLTISGFLTAKQSTTYNDAIDQFNAKYHGIVTIQSNIKDAISALEFKVYGVFVGNPSYIIIDQGNTVFVGGMVGKFRLTSVTDSKITLSSENYNLEIPLSQISNQQPLGGLDNQSRNSILSEEMTKNQQGLKNEQQQLAELKKYQPVLKGAGSAKFVQQQLHQLEEDIQAKKKDINTLEGILNAQ